MTAARASIEINREQRASLGETWQLREREPRAALLRAVEPDAELGRDSPVAIDPLQPLGVELPERAQRLGQELEQERRTERHRGARVRDAAHRFAMREDVTWRDVCRHPRSLACREQLHLPLENQKAEGRALTRGHEELARLGANEPPAVEQELDFDMDPFEAQLWEAESQDAAEEEEEED